MSKLKKALQKAKEVRGIENENLYRDSVKKQKVMPLTGEVAGECRPEMNAF